MKWWRSSDRTAPARRRCSRSWPGVLEPTEGDVSRPTGQRFGWVPQEPALYSKLSVAENLAAVRAARKARRPGERGERDAVPDRPGRPRKRRGRSTVRWQRAACQHRDRGTPSESARRRCSTSPQPRSIHASASACGSSSAGSPYAGRRSASRPTMWARPSATPAAYWSLVTASSCSRGTPAELERAVTPPDTNPADFEAAFVRFLAERGH